MAFDGVVTCAIISELNEKLLNGIIVKVAQPGKDELLFTIKKDRDIHKLVISSNPSMAVTFFVDDNIPSPLTAPNFCMSLRKHIGNGRIKAIFQPSAKVPINESSDGFERVVVFAIEHMDEMGEENIRYLSCELMGRNSNIILIKDDLTILDSIKHISHLKSSVREVLPGRKYFIPETPGKTDAKALTGDIEAFRKIFTEKKEGISIFKKIYLSIVGISPLISSELLMRAGIDPDTPCGDLSREEIDSLFKEFKALMEALSAGNFAPSIIWENTRPSEFSAIRLKSLEGGDNKSVYYESMSLALRSFYEGRESKNRLKAKSEDIRNILKTLTERAYRKSDLLEKQFQDAKKKDKYRLWGELINTYGYSLKGGEKFLSCENYLDDGKPIRIPLDSNLNASENAVKYFDRYQKLKRQEKAAKEQLKVCQDTIYHLESISESLKLALTDADLDNIRKEMAESGYIKTHSSKRKGKREEAPSKPLHFVSSDGIDIYVGRNNFQNEELTFKIASGDDWWFHAKNLPGSHVIAKTGKKELPDATCLEAASLAAFYSKAGGREKENLSKVEVDYVKKRELKKVPGGRPGFVIYHTNYSILIEPKDKI